MATDAELLEQLRSIVNSSGSGGGPGSGDPLAQPAISGSKYRMNINGTPVEFDNQQAAEESITQWGRSMQQEKAQLQAEIDRIKAQQTQAIQNQPSQPQQQGSGFDKKRYFEMLENDPITANRYLMSYQMFGQEVPNVDPLQLIGTNVLSQANTLNDIRLSQHFQGRLDLNNPQVRQAIDQERQRTGKPNTVDGWEDTYNRMVVQGRLPHPAQVEAARQEAMRNVVPIRQGLPATGATSGAQEDSEVLQNMRAMVYQIESDPTLTANQKLQKIEQFENAIRSRTA